MLLLENFHKLTIDKTNASKLKAFVLQLAVQGRLTKAWRKQNAGVEPASVLLERIRIEKENLIRKGKIKKEKPLPPISEEEKYLNIPEFWIWIRLNGLGNIFNGNSISKNIKEDKYSNLESGFPFIATKDVKYGFEEFDYDNGVMIPFDEPSFRIAHKGTVLICSEGGSAGKKCGIAKMDICFGNKLFAIEPYDYIEPIYILSLYLTNAFYAQFAKRMTGIIGGIAKSKLEDLPFPLPPIAEQEKIVSKVNQLIGQIEALEKQTEARTRLKKNFAISALKQVTTPSNGHTTAENWSLVKDNFHGFFDEEDTIKKLREAILQLAVQGKLTEAWRKENPDIEPASVLLEKIKEEKEKLVMEKKIKKEKPLPPIVENEIPYVLPDGWEWCRLGNTALEITYGTSQKTDDYNDVPVLRMGNITSDGRLIYSNLKYVSTEVKDLPRLYLKKHDLVFNRTNSYELVGKCGVYDMEDNEYTLASYLIKVSLFKQSVNPYYVNNYINSPICRKHQIEPQITQQTNQANFSGSKLKNILLPLPPAIEQCHIVTKVNQLMQLCDELEEQVRQSKEEAGRLMQVVMREVAKEIK